ncbi:carbon storage regulator CsrA [Desulfitibacter alkalitolerans]|uniref:carbon storage regulator CsrA n=1 Tax=Desulfitibacter alkalitolerans TaxID=264641 RepID=UPI000488DB8F|nr:carbon storage regulator CsrA [Desulfitibacter alkalitolerans]
MLIITRKINEGIVIDGDIKIVVLGIEGNRVKFGITAPRKTGVFREELIEAVKKENQLAGNASQADIDFTIFKSSK